MNGMVSRGGGIGARGPMVALGGLVAPLMVFLALRRCPALDRTVGSGTPHFYIVSAVALTALALAVVVLAAARRLPEPRTFFLALGFLAVSTIFLAHGVGTGPFFADHHHASVVISAYPSDLYDYAPAVGPQVGVGVPEASPVTVARGQVVGFSARLSLLVSALCFLLATVSPDERLGEWLVRRWWPLTLGAVGALCSYMTVALLWPTTLHAVAMQSTWLSWSVAAVVWGALAFAGQRFLQAYRLALLPLPGLMAVGMGWLAEAQLFMLLGPAWHLSWWEYHVVMLAGFLLPALGLLWQHRAAGDLGVLVEGMFLRDQVKGLRAGDPGALTVLAAAVSAKDSETGTHVERVGDLTVAIGQRLGLAEERLEILRWAGRLHDLGKLGVPNSILRKPGRLTDAEFAVIKRHSARGGQVASRSRALAEAASIIRTHHERLDGRGYPDGLAGDAIPLEARIVAVADVWDALTCDRPYRAAMSFDEAAAIMRRETGTGLDSRCVDALFAVLDEMHRAAVAQAA